MVKHPAGYSAVRIFDRTLISGRIPDNIHRVSGSIFDSFYVVQDENRESEDGGFTTGMQPLSITIPQNNGTYAASPPSSPTGLYILNSFLSVYYKLSF